MPNAGEWTDIQPIGAQPQWSDIQPIAPAKTPPVQKPGYLSEIAGGVKRGLSSLASVPGSLITPHETSGATVEQEKKMGPLGRLAYNIPADILQSAENATVAQQKAKREGQNWAGQTLSYMEQLPVVGAVTKKAEEAGPGYAKLSPQTVGAATEGTTMVAAPLAGAKVIEKAAPALAEGAGKLGKRVAPKLYQSALKPPPGSYTPEEASAIVQTGLKEGIPISDKGVAKLSGLLSDLQQQVKESIASNPDAPISPKAVAGRLAGTKAKFAKQVNPEADLAAIGSAEKEFLAQHQQPSGATTSKLVQKTTPEGQPYSQYEDVPVMQEKPIPAAKAQELKTGTYTQLKDRAYGELKSGPVESQKALARGLKEELNNIFPEIKGLNAREGRLYDLQPVLERAVTRITNHDILGLGAYGAATAGGIAMGSEALAGAGAFGILAKVLGDPAVKSHIAIAIDRASGKLLAKGAGAARVDAVMQGLVAKSIPPNEPPPTPPNVPRGTPPPAGGVPAAEFLANPERFISKRRGVRADPETSGRTFFDEWLSSEKGLTHEKLMALPPDEQMDIRAQFPKRTAKAPVQKSPELKKAVEDVKKNRKIAAYRFPGAMAGKLSRALEA